MDNKNFREQAHLMVDWMADYLENIEKYPVKSKVKPGDIYKQLDNTAPEIGEDMTDIFVDFQKTIMPGITHWQHPNFHAYFPANGSYPSLLAEMLTATLGAQCMVWDTSPSAAELEEKVLQWLQQMLGIPTQWVGVIQDTASTATLASILTAREKYTENAVNREGFKNQSNFRVYGSTETHSSIDKAVKIAGLGINNLVKVATDEQMAMDPKALDEAISQDIRKGHKPLCVIATLGTTATTAIDPIDKIASICKKYNTWLHIDAAFAGTALVLDEYRWMIEGMEMADSFVFNPHKWMFTNFDCSVYFVKDKAALLNTFEILPEYLKTRVDHVVNNYRDWGVPLGRRFRALKLWFVIRSFGIQEIQNRIRNHIAMAIDLAEKMNKHPNFELLCKVNFNMICFRYIHSGFSEGQLNEQNQILNQQLNDSGQIYLTHAKINGKYSLRMVVGQTYVQQHHINKAWALIQKMTETLHP